MDVWTAVAPAVLSLLGVGLGAGLSGRSATQRLAREERAAHRAELKATIMRFLELVRRVEAGEPALDELWLVQAELDLVAVSEPLRGAAFRLAQEPGDGALRREFMNAARADLWKAG